MKCDWIDYKVDKHNIEYEIINLAYEKHNNIAMYAKLDQVKKKERKKSSFFLYSKSNFTSNVVNV